MTISILDSIAKLKEKFNSGIQFGTGAMDEPDDRDYIAGSPLVKEFPTKKSIYTKANNLGFFMYKQSEGACTAYSETYRASIENTIEHGRAIILDAEAQWELQMQTGGKRKAGDFIQNAKKQFHKNPQGYPQTEYRRIDGDCKVAKKWLILNKPINTGVYWRWLPEYRMTNYKYMENTGLYIPGNGEVIGAHAILITGYDGEYIEFIESEITPNKSEKRPEGVFLMHQDHFESMMSKYISFDATDITPVIE